MCDKRRATEKLAEDDVKRARRSITLENKLEVIRRSEGEQTYRIEFSAVNGRNILLILPILIQKGRFVRYKSRISGFTTADLRLNETMLPIFRKWKKKAWDTQLAFEECYTNYLLLCFAFAKKIIYRQMNFFS
ncbi:hypothetical protein Trydic_g21106 [Trypoxylus dichotomus]